MAPFSDGFGRDVLGSDWLDTGRTARIKDGRLVLARAYNHPVWLRRKLPRNAVIEFDATTHSAAGDLKVELYGDGESFDSSGSTYLPTSYVVVLGGWDNTKSILGRLGEHEGFVKTFRTRENDEPVAVPGRTYHFAITRKGGRVDWKLDGAAYLSWDDPTPLQGPGHEYFAFSGWESEVSFDNLSIKPLD